MNVTRRAVLALTAFVVGAEVAMAGLTWRRRFGDLTCCDFCNFDRVADHSAGRRWPFGPLLGISIASLSTLL